MDMNFQMTKWNQISQKSSSDFCRLDSLMCIENTTNVTMYKSNIPSGEWRTEPISNCCQSLVYNLYFNLSQTGIIGQSIQLWPFFAQRFVTRFKLLLFISSEHFSWLIWSFPLLASLKIVPKSTSTTNTTTPTTANTHTTVITTTTATTHTTVITASLHHSG